MIWYPYEQMKTMKTPYKIINAEGVYLYTEDQKLIDSVSSWWSVIHGYKHPELNEAVETQLKKFAHVMLGGLTHEPAEKLSEKLQSWLPGDLDHCFFSDSGSVAVEVALEQAFAQYHDRLNCLIVEPLLQGAGGMRMYGVSFLERARELCDQYGVLLVFDEVATGFGRIGNRFAADLVLPDILVLGKALTGGYIGHAVTVANRKVYEGFYDDDPSHALMHGPTFMGNALVCSVALKSIELFEKQDYMSKIRRIEEITRREMEGFSDPRIKEIRIMGACVCIEVYDPDTIRGYQQFAYEHGVFSRPFLNYMYAMVPYVIREEELVKVLQTMKEWFS